VRRWGGEVVKKKWAIVLVGLLSLTLGGCTKPVAPVAVKGKVVYRGKGVGGAHLTFWPKNSREKQVDVFADPQGAFELECIPGAYKVTVLSGSRSGDPSGADGAGPIDARNPAALPVGGSTLPANVQDAVRTPLSIEVPGGGMEDVVLKLDP
jgi:hypothetical protein